MNTILTTLQSLAKILEPEKLTNDPLALFKRLFPAEKEKLKRKKALDLALKITHIKGENKEETTEKFLALLEVVDKTFQKEKKYLVLFFCINSDRKLKNSLISHIKNKDNQAQAAQYLYYLHRIAIEEDDLKLAAKIVDLTKHLHPLYAEELLKQMSNSCIEEDCLDGYDAIYIEGGRYIVETCGTPPYDSIHEYMLESLNSEKGKICSSRKWRLKYDPFYSN